VGDRVFQTATQVTGLRFINGPRSPGWGLTRFRYDDTGRLAQLLYYGQRSTDKTYKYVFEQTFSYDAEGRLERAILSADTETRYYWAGANIKRYERYYRGKLSSWVAYQYDDKPNPLQVLSTIEFSPEVLSQNNVIATETQFDVLSNRPPWRVIYDYVYDFQRRPTRQVVKGEKRGIHYIYAD
jgi:hypothetical protein